MSVILQSNLANLFHFPYIGQQNQPHVSSALSRVTNMVNKFHFLDTYTFIHEFKTKLFFINYHFKPIMLNEQNNLSKKKKLKKKKKNFHVSFSKKVISEWIFMPNGSKVTSNHLKTLFV